MASDESDDEPLSVLAAAKKADAEKLIKKLGLEIDIEEYDPRPKKKKSMKTRNIIVKDTITIHYEPKLKKPAQLIIRPQDVWLYLKDLNPVGPYSCLLCSEWFISRAKVLIHYILNHKKDYCGICRYFVSGREAWDTHLEFHTPWPCSQCEGSFPSERELRQHLSTSHNLVHCRLCHFRVPDNDQYKCHLLQKHNVSNAERINEEPVWEIEPDEKYSCVLCSKPNNPYTNFFSHYLGHHHFTIRCIASVLSGKETPFTMSGADLSAEFAESLKDLGKCGYVDLDRQKTVEAEFDIKLENDLPVNIKEEIISDTEGPKKEITIRDDFDIIKTYRGDEDFDVTSMELIILEKTYYEYMNKIITDLNSKIFPLNSNIDYEKEKLNIIAEFDCSLCETRLNTSEAFVTHMAKMHSVKSVPIFSCRICATPFDSLHELEQHINLELGDFEDLWLCQFCDREFDNRISTRSHLSEHQDAMEYDNCFSPHLGFKCRHCPTLFWNEPDREVHQIKAHFEQDKEYFYTCECKEIFSDKIWFTYHYFKNHQQNNPSISHLFKCYLCSLVLPSVKEMRHHFGSEHPSARKVFCSLDGCQYKPLSHKKSLQLHLRAVHRSTIRKEEPCSCDVCGRNFPNARACSAHSAQAHGAGKFKCQLCKLMLHSMDERKLHYLLLHPGKHPFSCKECGKSFLYKSSLYIHRKEHSAVKEDFTCDICHKVFAKKDSFREHQLIHSGERHACSYCPMRFVQRSNMLRHERRHTGERPYTCPHCNRAFADKGACNAHTRTHNRQASFDCLYCGQSFVQKSKLTYHIRRHTGENLETCPVCSKLFTSACSLREHMKTHEAKKKEEIKCPLCDRTYTDARYMVRHLRGAHTASRHPCPICSKRLSSLAGLRHHVLTHGDTKLLWCKFCPKSYNIKKTMVKHLRRRHGLKGAVINVKDFFRRLDPWDCKIKLDDETMTSIFGPPKKKVMGDFISFPNKITLPKKRAATKRCEKIDDVVEETEGYDNDNNDTDDTMIQNCVSNETESNGEDHELEPTDFVSVKIEPMDE